MDTLDTALISAIVALAGAVALLYRDRSKDARNHAGAIKDLGEKVAASMKEASEGFAKTMKETQRDHAEQEERIHAQYQKASEDMVRDHKREMTGMVDRALEATKNDKEHDRDVAERVLRLAESLERRAQWAKDDRRR